MAGKRNQEQSPKLEWDVRIAKWNSKRLFIVFSLVLAKRIVSCGLSWRQVCWHYENHFSTLSKRFQSCHQINVCLRVELAKIIPQLIFSRTRCSLIWLFQEIFLIALESTILKWGWGRVVQSFIFKALQIRTSLCHEDGDSPPLILRKFILDILFYT